MKFIHTHNNQYGSEIESISMELHEHASLSDALDTFTRFLRAVGFHFDGSVEIVPEDCEIVPEDFKLASEQFDNIDYSEYEEQFDVTGPPSSDWPFPTSTKP